MSKKTHQYTGQDIVSLKGADRVRKRPAVIFGSDGLEGCEHSVFEIISNSVDEAKEGYGDVINITVFEDNSIQVEDFGRGVPLGYNEKEQRYNWELIYCELYAGGKYNNNDASSAYEYSLGLNGLGACATQYSSEFMDVKSYNGTHCSHISFKKGEPCGELEVTELAKNQKRTGTVVMWKPDIEVFTDIVIPLEYFLDMLKKQAVVNAGTKFHLDWRKGEPAVYDFLYEDGIVDYVKEIVGDQNLTQPAFWKTETQGRDREDKDEYKLKMEVCFCISNTINTIEYYHNSSFLEHGGSPDKAVKSAFVSEVDKYLKANGKYNKNEAKITFSDVEDCLVIVTNSHSTQASYANQTKKAITNTFIAEAMTAFLKQNLAVFFAENPIDAERMCNQILVNKRSREHAETTRLDLKKKLANNPADLANRVDKFVNCRSKDPSVRELYIVEGNSAMSSCKLGRSAEFQAIIPVRGKTLNCLKSPYEKIFNNDIILDLLRVIGCGVEIKGKVKGDIVPFDLASLRWNKIIICTDADKDGFQIRTLLLTVFYRLLPTLIKEGKVYIAESPLYQINSKQGTFFAYDENEMIAITKKLEGTKYTLQRSKGLGENDPEMMWETTMNPATRRLIQVNEADQQQTEYIFDTLLGDDLPARKEFIAKYGSQYISDVDLDG